MSMSEVLTPAARGQKDGALARLMRMAMLVSMLLPFVSGCDRGARMPDPGARWTVVTIGRKLEAIDASTVRYCSLYVDSLPQIWRCAPAPPATESAATASNKAEFKRRYRKYFDSSVVDNAKPAAK